MSTTSERARAKKNGVTPRSRSAALARRGAGRLSKKAAQLTLKEREALRLRQAGHTFEEIAEIVGWKHKMSAWDAVCRAIQKTLQEPADELIKIELERLDRMHNVWWEACLEGSQEAFDNILKLMARRARLLGLDAPTRRLSKVEVSGAEGMVKQVHVYLPDNGRTNPQDGRTPTANGSNGVREVPFTTHTTHEPEPRSEPPTPAEVIDLLETTYEKPRPDPDYDAVKFDPDEDLTKKEDA